MSRLDYFCYRKWTQEDVSLQQKIADVVIRSIQLFLPISTWLDEGLPPPEEGDGVPSTSAGGCSSTAGWGYNRLVRGRRQVADTQSSSTTVIAADVSGIAQVSVAGVASTVASANAPTTTLSSTTPTLGGGTTSSTQPILETTSIPANSDSSTAVSDTGPSTTLVSTPTPRADTGTLLSTSTITSTSPSLDTEHQVPASSTTAPTVAPQVSISPAPSPTTSVGISPTVPASPPLITSTTPLPVTTSFTPPATTAPPAPPARKTSVAPPSTTTSVAPPPTTTSVAPPPTTTSVAPPPTTTPPPPTTTTPAPPPTTTTPAPPPTTTTPPPTTITPTPPPTTTTPVPPPTTTTLTPPTTTTLTPPPTTITLTPPPTATALTPPPTTSTAAPPVTAISTTPPATTTSTAPPAATTSVVPSTTSMSSISTSIAASPFTTDNQSTMTSATAPSPTTMSESSTATSTLSQVETSSSSTLFSPMSSMPSSTITATSILSTTTPSPVSHPPKPSTTSSSSSAAPLTSTPLPESFTSLTSTSRFSIPLPDTIFSDPRMSTMTITTVWTSTYFGGQVTTYSTVVETGVLRTDSPKPKGFALNTGGIIAVALSATLFLILLVVVIFFTCRRLQFRQTINGSSSSILNGPLPVRRLSLGDGDEYDNPQFAVSAHPHQLPPFGDRYSGEGDNRGAGPVGGSAEGSASSLPLQVNPLFGGQPYMPGLGQTLQTVVPHHNYSSSAAMSTPGLVRATTSASAVNIPDPVAAQSATSLIVRDASISRSHDLGSSSSGDAPLTFSTARRGSLPGPRATPLAGDSRRHSSTPPTSFPPEHQGDIERSVSVSDRGNQRGFGFLKGLRTRSKSSAQSMVTVRGAPRTNGSLESLASRTASYYGAIPGPSSLLNPGPPPSPPLLRVNGESYQGLPIPIWPPVTLPPSPVPTANSSMVMIENLLHPRLGILGGSQQASSASLKDNEDYMRPISGQLLNSDHRSTTTLVTQEAAGGSDAVGMAS